MNNHYNKNLKEFARELRYETATRGEKYLWYSLLARGRSGVKFKRQRPIDRFIVDFFAAEIGLIIEIDGNSHYSKGDYDRYRQNRLEELGYTVIRFKEGDVIHNIHEVTIEILHAVDCLRSKMKKK